MPRKPFILALSALLFLVFSAEAFGHASCKTRSKCRWWSNQYIASASVGCWYPSFAFTLCYQRGSSCGKATANCGWKRCLWGGASASATNDNGWCTFSASRSGLGRYGEEVTEPTPDSDNGEGSHEGLVRTEYRADGSAAVHFQQMRMTSTLDESFSRIDVVAYVESHESLENDSDDFPPERVLYRAYIHLQNGIVSHQGFDQAAAEYRDATNVTEVDLSGSSLSLPVFEGTPDELDRVAIDVVVDGGQPAVPSNE
ncbi:MAG: hypothetical protein AAGC60_15690 [Acidobacteriota bacterium]